MEYATKLLVIVSMAGAIALETLVTARVWPALLPLTIAVFVVAAAISVVHDEACAAIVLAFGYVMPALILVVHGNLLLYFGARVVGSAARRHRAAKRPVRMGGAAAMDGAAGAVGAHDCHHVADRRVPRARLQAAPRLCHAPCELCVGRTASACGGRRRGQRARARPGDSLVRLVVRRVRGCRNAVPAL